MKDYGAEMPMWGFAGAPLVDGTRLICLVGGEPNAKVVAFDKTSGKEIWRAPAVDLRAWLRSAGHHRRGRHDVSSSSGIPLRSARSIPPPDARTGSSRSRSRTG